MLHNAKEKMVVRIFLRSPDGETGWTPITREEVPAWIMENDAIKKEMFEQSMMTSNPEGGDTNFYVAMTEEEFKKFRPVEPATAATADAEVLH